MATLAAYHSALNSKKRTDVWLRWNQDAYLQTTNSTGYHLNTWNTNNTVATTNTVSGNGFNDWVWQPVKFTFTLDTACWDNWNDQWTETEEQKRARQVRGEVARARASTSSHGPEQYPWARYLELAVQGLGELTDDERRLIEDGWQRGVEEYRERLHRAEQDRLAREERERQQAEANRRAELLLLSLLGREQKKEWLAHRRVTEVAPSGRVWRLFPQWAGGACLMEGDVRRATLCVHPRTRVPDVDNIVALLACLRGGDEDYLIQIAILHAGTWTAEEQEIRRHRPPMRQVRIAEGLIEVPA